MSVIVTKPLPHFRIVHPDGSRSSRSAPPSLLASVAYNHVVEVTIDGTPLQMHHWDVKGRGALENSMGTNILKQPGAIQKKGQRRKRAYGDIWLMSLHSVPSIRVEMSAADLQNALAAYLPGTKTYEVIVDHDVFDVFFIDENVTQQELIKAVIAFG